VRLSTSDDFREMKNSIVSLMRHIGNAEIYTFKERIKEIEIYKDEIQDYFDLLQMWFRDVLYYKATNHVRGLIYQQEAGEIKAQAEKVTYFGLQQVFDAIDKATLRLKFNGNFELTLELLLLEMKKIFN